MSTGWTESEELYLESLLYLPKLYQSINSLYEELEDVTSILENENGKSGQDK